MLSHFSHIYYEPLAIENETGRAILKKFPKAALIEISDHRDMFNRKRQDWRLQKESLKIILANKKSEFYYPGSDVTPNFNHKNFYYNTLLMNCIYDCHYCYLQGMYPSANIVIFTNLEDYFTQTDSLLEEKGEVYLSISYDTDLLAFENIVPYCKKWIEYASSRKNIIIELRTKSANFNAIKDSEIPENFILAWTLSPDNIIRKYETKTPGLKARLDSVAKAMHKGCKVRLCIDPILIVENWQSEYKSLLEEIKNSLDVDKIHDISLGTFRMNKDYFQKAKDRRYDSDLLHFPYKSEAYMTGYSQESKTKSLNELTSGLLEFMPKNKIFTI